MRILLINPPFQRLARVYNTYFPLGMGYVASVLEQAGHHVRIYNADKGKEEEKFCRPTDRIRHIESHTNYIRNIKDENHYVWKEIKDTIAYYKPEVVGIQAMTSTFPSAKKVARMAKEYSSDIPVIFGGIHPTTVPEEVICERDIDFAVIGEGEITTKELIGKIEEGKGEFSSVAGIYYKLNGEIIKNPAREFISDLDMLPFPGRHLVLHPELYTHEFGALLMGRGCPFKCTFCGSKVIWTRKVRSRTPENVVAEIEYVRNKYGVRSFSFQDDTLTFSTKRLLKLCGLLINKKLNIHWSSFSRVEVITNDILPIMKKSGCHSLGFGVESGSDRMLKIMKKQTTVEQAEKARELLKRHGIAFCGLFLIGTPDETVEDLQATINFIKRTKPDFVNVCTYTPYPGTEMYERAKALGAVTNELDHIYFSHHSNENMFVKFISKEDYTRLRGELIELADSLTNKIDAGLVRDMIKLLISDPNYFIKRVPYYIKGLPRYISKTIKSYRLGK